MSKRVGHTIGCLVLVVMGVAAIAAGIAAGASVDWNLVAPQVESYGRSRPPLFLVPSLIIGGGITLAAGIFALRLPVESGKRRDE